MSSPGVIKTNSSSIPYLLKEYTPPDDSLRYYAVTGFDSSGNESGISNVVYVSSDRTAPSVSSIVYRYFDSSGSEVTPVTAAGTGSVYVYLTVSEVLKELPFFSLEPSEGSPIVITMNKTDDTHYGGSFNVTPLSPSGPTIYKFSGKDMTGNRGNAQGAGISIDVKGPEASIQSPLQVLQISRGEVSSPVQVDIVFNEPSVITPELDLKDSAGHLSLVTDFESEDNGIHWNGSVDSSNLSEGQATFILKEAKDRLGNTGTTVTSGRTILLYRDNVPPPDVPEGLTSKSAKAGVVTLTWYPVSGASTYNLYRRAEGETTQAKIKTGIQGSPAQDTPPSDGTYYYSVTSIGLLESESQKSAEIQAVSDRTGPAAPANMSLSLDGSGVTATWDAPSLIPPYQGGTEGGVKGYNAYRSGSPIVSTSGLTPFAKVANTRAVDTAPIQSQRFYAVAAVDLLDNEGPVSVTKEIVFPVSPVRDLSFERLDDAAPRISWQAPAEGNIIGYHIYRNGSLITQYPVIDLAYTDAYYSGGSVTYGISAINNLGNEGPIKEATLHDISMKIKEGTILRRGLLETANLILSNPTLAKGGEGGFSVDTISVKAGNAPQSVLTGPFDMGQNVTLQLEKVISTTADAPSTVAVLLTATWSPSPGVTIKITKTSTAEVTGSGSAFEIFNDPLIRGTDGHVRIKVNNLGTAQMEFLTNENSSATRKVAVYLNDEDGNLLSTGYLNQRVGNTIVDTGKYAVARLNPNEDVMTEPITISVPMSAPYRVIIEAAIENTYYHYNKTDQVTAPGMRQSVETTIWETAYRAYAEPEYDFYPAAQPVLITGQAISNLPTPDPSSLGGSAWGGQFPTPVPFVPVKLGISVNGFDRYYTVTTDANGHFSYTFNPGANEAGTYSVWAIHPDVKDRSVQSTFAIAGLSINPSSATVRMARGKTVDIPVTISNYGGGQLNGLTFNIQSSTGITASVISPSSPGGEGSILTAGEKEQFTLRITTASAMPDTGYAKMTATTGEGLTVKLDASITLVSLIPVINTTPSYIDTGMVRGNQKIASFTVSNTGQDVLRNAHIEGPSTSWMTLTVNKTIGDVNPGASTSVGIMLSPPDTLAQGVYDDTIVIYSDNHIPYTYHIQVTVTSNAVGNVLFDIVNQLMEDVPNATITFQHQTLLELIYTVKTGADGSVMQYDIPEGRYTFTISPPPGHSGYSGSFVISPGITTTVPMALEMQMVTVEWSVTPVTIEDRYEITIKQTFETNVPTPVLVIEPPNINLPVLQPGQVFNGEFKVTNYGLIEIYDVKLEFPTSLDDYDIEVMTSAIPDKLGAMKSVTVPYRITRRIATLSATSLYDEVRGYGGSQCPVKAIPITVKGKCVICPNSIYQRVVDVIRSFLASILGDCPPQTQPGGVYVPPPPCVGSGCNSVCVGEGCNRCVGSGCQAGEGTMPGTSPAIATDPAKPCECKEECANCDAGDPKKKCVDKACKRIDLISVDAEVKAKKEVYLSVDEAPYYTALAQGENCEFEYQWNFGDGETSSLPNLYKEYHTQGVFYPFVSTKCRKCSPPPVRDQVTVVVGCITDHVEPDKCCVSPGKWVPNNPIQDLDQCPNRVQNPNWMVQHQATGGYEYDGCSYVSDNPVGSACTSFVDPINREGACDYHDRCYQTCAQGDLIAAQFSCDRQLREKAIDNCRIQCGDGSLNFQACVRWAYIYETGLNAFGLVFYPQRQKEVCQCCP